MDEILLNERRKHFENEKVIKNEWMKSFRIDEIFQWKKSSKINGAMKSEVKQLGINVVSMSSGNLWSQ